MYFSELSVGSTLDVEDTQTHVLRCSGRSPFIPTEADLDSKLQG